jgi:hypothetical protein
MSAALLDDGVEVEAGQDAKQERQLEIMYAQNAMHSYYSIQSFIQGGLPCPTPSIMKKDIVH